MEVNFKFEVGQGVYLRQELERWHGLYGALMAAEKKRGYESMGMLSAKERKPTRVQVIERHMQQCYGGIQLHYSIRSSSGLAQFTEPELLADFDDPSVTTVEGN